MNNLEEHPDTNQNLYDQLTGELHGRQNLILGFIGGLVAAVIGAVIWASITVATGWQIGYMAIAVGFLVGYAVRTLGKGVTPVFGCMGALLALFGCLLGNYFSIIGFIGDEIEMGYFETLKSVPVKLTIELMKENFSVIDILFYGIAIYQGYKLSFDDMNAVE